MKALLRKLMKAQSKLMLDCNFAFLQQCEKQNQSIIAFNRPRECRTILGYSGYGLLFMFLVYQKV